MGRTRLASDYSLSRAHSFSAGHQGAARQAFLGGAIAQIPAGIAAILLACLIALSGCGVLSSSRAPDEFLRGPGEGRARLQRLTLEVSSASEAADPRNARPKLRQNVRYTVDYVLSSASAQPDGKRILQIEFRSIRAEIGRGNTPEIFDTSAACDSARAGETPRNLDVVFSILLKARICCLVDSAGRIERMDDPSQILDSLPMAFSMPERLAVAPLVNETTLWEMFNRPLGGGMQKFAPEAEQPDAAQPSAAQTDATTTITQISFTGMESIPCEITSQPGAWQPLQKRRCALFACRGRLAPNAPPFASRERIQIFPRDAALESKTWVNPLTGFWQKYEFYATARLEAQRPLPYEGLFTAEKIDWQRRVVIEDLGKAV